MTENKYPKPPSHRTFTFGSVTIDSDFDSGNCSHAQKISNTIYQIWLGTDNPKNNYRTWFYFSVAGFNQGTCISFKIKNMQNQSKLLSQGLVPVYRQQSSEQWRRIKQKINLKSIEYHQGWIQWTFKHTFTTNEKVYLALFYPWSNQDNSKFLDQIQDKVKQITNFYFHRSCIINTIQGRDVELIVISSTAGKLNKEQNIQDKNLFLKGKKPYIFNQNKKGIVISARVHPGQIPGSHVMNGIIKQLTQNNDKAKILRDNFVFYIFPILNPDGVARGHYRVDTNGINLNRCYINPNPKTQPSIYAIRNIISHLSNNNRFFAFLDLHAHAARKGTFIYGNSVNQLQKQVQTCLFPKILSMNSQDFEYEASNFTQQNMYCKDKADHISKQGSGRVAMFKLTKNPFCWTLQCNYNMSKINNILQPRRSKQSKLQKPNQNNLNQNLIITYRNPPNKQSTQFFTIQLFHKLGKQICESFLDLIQKNPQSRIDNPQNYFKSVQNLKMNLAIALMRMAPNRFQGHFRKIYNGSSSQNQQIANRSLQALYYIIIKNAKIININGFIKQGDTTGLMFQESRKVKSTTSSPKKFSSLLDKIQGRKQRIHNEIQWRSQKYIDKCSMQIFDLKQFQQKQCISSLQQKIWMQKNKYQQVQSIQNLISQKLKLYQKQKQYQPVTSYKFQNTKAYGLISFNPKQSLKIKYRDYSPIKNYKIKYQNNELPALTLKKKSLSGVSQNTHKNLFRADLSRDPLLFIEAD